ncbi:hypothetical protein [Nocardiopsis sp. CNR-923]|nr:hypothetical protein [Nocardiopsis sp. CNR-923]
MWTDSLWTATARSRAVKWRTEIEPTPEQLEERLRRHAHPPAPAPTRDR